MVTADELGAALDCRDGCAALPPDEQCECEDRPVRARTTIRFAAVTEEPDEGWMGVSLAEDEYGDGWTLNLQRGWTEPDAQDVALGQDTHCLTDEHGRTCYGGVVSAELDRNMLSLRLSAEAVEVLGLDCETVEMVLDLPAPLIGQVRDGLSRVLVYGDPRKRPRSVAL